MRGTRVTGRRVLLGVGAAVLVLLVLGQLLLPSIAARVVRDKLGDPDADVTVKAFPAWKMALGRVDSIDVSAGTVQRSDTELADLLDRAKKVGRITSALREMTVGGVRLRDVRSRIEDGRLEASATVTIEDLQAMAPGGARLTVLPSGSGGEPRFQVTVGVLGIQQTIDLAVTANEGRVEVAPDNALGAIFQLTVFQNERLWIESVRATSSGRAVRLDVTGSLR